MDLYELAIRFKSEGFKAVSRDMDTLDKKGRGISKAFTALKASLVVGAVGTFIQKIATESIEAQKQAAQLNAVLKSTGGIAGVTAGEVDQMAGALQRTTVFSDDAVKSAASLLLTFTNIRGEVFRQTLPAITDLATAMGTDLKSAAIQVGKALNDPINGVSALQRVGVSFSAAQKEVIKNLVETNRLADAQGIILKELNVQFGGSAAAARNTLGGALEGLKNSWGDLFEVTTDGTTGVVGAINRLSDALDRNKEKWQGWASSILDPSGGAVPVLSTIIRFMNRIVELQNKIGAWLHGGAGMGRGGGAGGGRDTPTGLATLPGAVVMAQKPPAPFGGGGTGKLKGIDLPGGQAVDVDFGGLRQFEPQEGEFDWTTSAESAAMEAMFKAEEKRKEAFREYNERLREDAERAAQEMQATLAGVFGAAIYNGIAAGFDGEGLAGIFASLGKTILSGLGQVFVMMGEKMIAASAIMEAFQKAIMSFFPGGGFVAGALLVALGAAMGAMGSKGGGRTGGGGRYSSGSGPSRMSEEITRFKFIDRNGSLVNSLRPMAINNVTIIGPNDPSAQRAWLELQEKSARRNG